MKFLHMILFVYSTLLFASSIHEQINDKYKSIKYVNDTINYHKIDYWATPKETLTNNSGDCEDIAILKYYTLLSNGSKDSDLYYVVLKPHNRKYYNHMILWDKKEDLYMDLKEIYKKDKLLEQYSIELIFNHYRMYYLGKESPVVPYLKEKMQILDYKHKRNSIDLNF